MIEMQGRKQLEREATIGAPVGVVYGLFMDNAELPRWAPVVDAVTSEVGGEPSGVGCTRTCAVTLDGEQGTMVERCIEAVRDRRASFLVVDDSFGFTRMIEDYGFTVHFKPAGEDRTTVTMETFYTPANPMVAVMNLVMMRRKFRGIVDRLLGGLAQRAEVRHRAGI